MENMYIKEEGYTQHFIVKVWKNPRNPKFFEYWGYHNALKAMAGWTECGYITDLFQQCET